MNKKTEESANLAALQGLESSCDLIEYLIDYLEHVGAKVDEKVHDRIALITKTCEKFEEYLEVKAEREGGMIN
ncbi:MAG: hypothetical protein DRN81_02380 [Thermoproteota archaeon]|nr:MAG: hypothetical protein DRN81_02380 [Candidatus Korarchaeota archaeon]